MHSDTLCLSMNMLQVQARKALSALKGLVKIQAMIRGEIARRRLIAILKCMIPFPNSLLHIQLLRAPILDDSRYENQKKLLMSQNDITRSRELKVLSAQIVKIEVLRSLNFCCNLSVYMFLTNIL